MAKTTYVGKLKPRIHLVAVCLLFLLIALPKPVYAGILTTLTLDPAEITGGYPSTGTFRWVPCKSELNCSDVEEVTLSSSNATVATVPSTIFIDPRLDSESFQITTKPVSTPKSVTITATKNGVSRTATLVVCPINPRLISFALPLSQTLGGLPVDATIGLDCIAPPSGLQINFLSSNPAVATIPASVTVPGGEKSHLFTDLVRTLPVSPPTSVNISASRSGVTLTASLLVLPGLENLNLTVNRIEVTQAIQCLDAGICPDNVLPLVKNKTTAVRVYFQAEGINLEIDRVRAALASRPCGATGGWTDHPSYWPTARVNPTKTIKQQRNSPQSPGDAAYNLTFLVDRQYLEGGCLDFRAEVNPSHAIFETNYSDNTFNLSNIAFNTRGHLNIKFVRIDYCPHCPFSNTSHYKPSWSTVDDILSYLRKVYPLDQINYWKSHKEVNVVSTTIPQDFSKEAAWNWVLIKLWFFNYFTDYPLVPTDSDPPNVHYYGLLDERVPHEYGLGRYRLGLGSYKYRVAAGIAGDGPTAAQEIAHNFERYHAPCGNPDDVDPSWPVSTNPLAIIGQTGFDVETGLALRGELWHDFMSYCDREWISPYTYETLYALAGPVALDLLAAPETQNQTQLRNYLIVSGVMDSDGSVFYNEFYVTPLPTGNSDFVGTGVHSIKLQAADGRTLFTRHFDFLGPHQPGEGAIFEIIPYDSQTARIVISLQTATGAMTARTRVVSAHAPTVRVTFPNSTMLLRASDVFTATWTASDADGDSLSYIVSYSQDGGDTWEALVIGLRGTSYTMDASLLPGTDQALIRVTASDGVNTTHDDSDATFIIERKGPEVAILNPAQRMQIKPGSPLVLRGTAVDIEDGSLTDQALTWSSSSDGRLGVGSELVVNLSPGLHVITLTARDTDGNISSATMQVDVRFPSRILPPIIIK